MSDPLKGLLLAAKHRDEANAAKAAGRAIARHCDIRIRAMRKALRLIDTFAWSCVSTDHPKAAKELQRRLDAVRKALAEDIANYGPRP